MATLDQLCTLCIEDGVSKVAKSWCSNCETFLCEDCEKHHRRSKASKNHELVTSEYKSRLPPSVQKSGNKCDTHERMREFYCQLHQVACCVRCLQTDHKDCRDFIPLSEVIDSIKSSSAVLHLETDIKRLKSNLIKAKDSLLEQIENLHDQKSKCFDEICQIREKINSHLDIIEKQLKEDLSSRYSKMVAQKQKLHSDIDEKLGNIQKLEEDFATVKLYGANLQVFSAMNSFEKITKEEFSFLCEIQDNGDLNNAKYLVDASSVLEMCELKSFGKVLVGDVETPSIFDSESTIQVPKSTINVENLHPELIKILDIHSYSKGDIWNCLICPNGQKIFVDQTSNQLIRYSNNNSYIDRMSLKHMPRDVCFMESTDDSNTIAVTFSKEMCLSIVELETHKVVKSLNVPYHCYRKHFYICFADDGKIGKLNMDGTLISLIGIPGSNTAEISVSKNRIYCTNWKLNIISCYTTYGQILWTYKHNDINEPRGLSVDKNDFVYVACSGNNKVVAINPDGKSSKVILTEENGINEPKALHVNRELSLLLVSNLDGALSWPYQL